MGDSHPQVLSECFIGLLKLAPEQSLPFVAQYLDLEQPSSEMAALALGESQLEAAFPILQQSWEHSHLADYRRTALMAIAMLRHDQAIGFLLELIATGSLPDATNALQALKVYRNDQGLWTRGW